MATLRSALRGAPPPTCALPPVPPGSSSEYDTSSNPTALRSRFSAETLMIKPSPSKTLKSFFSVSSPADGSAPALSSTLTTKRYHRRLSATQAARAAREEGEGEGSPPRLGHFPSPSESRLNLDTTSPSDSIADCHPSSPPERTRRGSFAGVGHSRSRSRSRPSLRGRRTSSSNGNGNGTGIGALDAAADKLAAVAREALGKLTTSGRHRAPRQQSSETSSARDSSSSSAPAPPPPPPPAVTTALFDSHNVEEPSQHVREPSAGSVATDSSTTSSASSARRRGRLPELAAARPRPRHLPANPRPVAPPSPTIPPLKYTSRTTTTATNNQFRAHAVRVPSSEILRTYDHHDLFVRLDVGGQSSYMTTVATLLEAEDGGGKLGEFVAALFLEEGSTASRSSLAPIDDEPDPSSQSAPPPPPPLPHSPFPFAGDEISLFDHGSSSSSISFFDDPTASPSSIDPLVHTALIGEHFSFSFPPLIGDAPSPTTPTLKVSPSQNAQRVFSLVPSPTYPSGIRKHTSVYPDVGPSRASVVPVKAEGTAVLPAMVFDELDLPPLQMASSSPSCSSSSFSGDSESPSLPSSSSSSEPESFIDFGGPGDTPRRPHFEVMREQLYRQEADAQDPSSPARAPGPAAHFRESLTYGKVQRPKDQMSTVEAFTKRAFESVTYPGADSHAFSRREMESAQLCCDSIKPETPRLKVAEARQQQQRLSSSAQRSTPLADRTIDIFLDRTDFPISSPHHLAESGAGEVATVYSALLAVLRGGAFPAVLSIPEFDPTMPVSASSESDTGAFLRPESTAVQSYLATFKTIKDEARWLGLQAAERACDRYIQHLYRLASAGSGGGSAMTRDARKMPGEKAPGREGWI